MRRKNRGYALISITVIGLFAVMFLMGLANIALAISRSEGIQKQKSLLNSKLDFAADYAIDYINKSRPSTYPVNIEVPATDLPTDIIENSVKIRISNLDATGASWDKMNTFSILASPSFYPEGTDLNSLKQEYKLVEMTATRGAFTKSATMILEPQIPLSKGQSNYLNFPGTQVNPLFPAPLYTTSKLTVYSDVEVAKFAEAGSPSLTIHSKDNAQLEPGSKIVGDLHSQNFDFPASDPPTRPIVDGDLFTSADPAKVSTNIEVTGQQQAYSDTTESSNIFPSNQSTIPFPAYSGNSINLSPGAYQSSGFSSTTPDSYVLSSSSSAPPTKLYIDNSSGNTVLNSSSFTNVNSINPSNFQIFYAGENLTIDIPNKSFNAVIYAPNAAVTVQGNGTFQGAIMANTVDLKAKTNLMTSVSQADPNTQMGKVNNDLGLTYASKAGKAFFSGFKPVTWQETTTKLVP